MERIKMLTAILLVAVSFIGHGVFALAVVGPQQKTCVQVLKR